SYVYAGHRLVATLGVNNFVVVETADAVLVAPRDRVQEVKQVVNQLKRERRQETSLHREVYRPWGSCDSIGAGERYQVKRLIIRPGGSQSLQMHHHRAEHWVVVHGTAEVTCEDEVFTLSENQSTYIPVGSRHRIHNPGSIPLEMIEIQTGSHISEDDIVHLEDEYGETK
ncbi:MAG: cupin domain-containing protein, partial [Gammaproteobacteria bacterium]|nr:cupin domain-containing protein [Gammaproteobacteria bacterium]